MVPGSIPEVSAERRGRKPMQHCVVVVVTGRRRGSVLSDLPRNLQTASLDCPPKPVHWLFIHWLCPHWFRAAFWELILLLFGAKLLCRLMGAPLVSGSTPEQNGVGGGGEPHVLEGGAVRGRPTRLLLEPEVRGG